MRKSGSGIDWYEGSAARCMSALDDEEDSFPTAEPSPYLMSNDEEDREVTHTLPAPPSDFEPEERKTNPEASRGPLLPPAPLTLEDSYLDRAIRVVAEAGATMARDREERRQQHLEVLAKLDLQGAKQDDAARLVVELGATLELLSGEFKRFRDASEARLAEGDARFRLIEDNVEGLKREIQRYVAHITELERLLAELKTNGPARPPTTST